jgi:hypothetical protein
MEDRILTLHPEGKTGVNIAKDKYEAMKAAILDQLATAGPQTHADFRKAITHRLEGTFDGSINWYLESVKLDLEARGIIAHNRKSRLVSLAQA